MKNRWIALVVTLLLTVALSYPAAAGAAFTVTDMTGRSVSFNKVPQRIVCICPGALRLIVYLQAQDLVVGTEDMEKRSPKTRPYYFTHPRFDQLPSAGPGGPNTINKEPDYEKILAIRPDVIFVTYMERGLADRVERKIGVPVFVLSYGPFGTFDDKVFDSILAAGKVLDREARAKAVVDFIQAQRRDLLARVKGFPEHQKPWVYIGGIGFKGTHGIESTETIYPPFEWVGARNAAKQGGKIGHQFLDKEQILRLDPEIIFIDGGGTELVRQDLAKRPEFYQGLTAFRNKRVYALHSYNWYMTNLGTVIADAYAVGKILYPERFKDVDPAERADAVYTFLVGRPAHAVMTQVQGPLGQVVPYLN